ncbi:MAG: PEP-utilizing enzyme [archaeon]
MSLKKAETDGKAMPEFPLDLKKEIFRWGPIFGKMFYPSEFVRPIFHDFPEQFKGHAWPKILFLFKGGRIVWLNEFPALRKAGKKVFLEYMLPEASRISLRKRWDEQVLLLKKFEASLDKTGLAALSDKELLKLGRSFDELINDFWPSTIPQELGNYGSDVLLRDSLARTIKDDHELSEVMEALTAPEKSSFYQYEEVELSEAKDLEVHQKKYFWLKNSYNGTAVLPVDFFRERKKELPTGLRKIMDKKLAMIKSKKKQMRNKYKLSADIMEIASALSYGTAWQDERKKEIFITQHYKQLFLDEIARRENLPADDLTSFMFPEVLDIFSGKLELKDSMAQRKRAVGFYVDTYNLITLSPELTEKLWDIYAEEKVGKPVDEVKGILASKGTKPIIRGTVRVVLDPMHAESFKEGDILVAPMTSPEYVFVMKRAGAIITDTGGLTSHAVIVSRELNKACIVGTKIATKVFKDGDLVEVDAQKGIVRKI